MEAIDDMKQSTSRGVARISSLARFALSSHHRRAITSNDRQRMRTTAQILILQALVVIFTIAAAAKGATFKIRLIQNDDPSPTLFLCAITVEEGKVTITGTGYSRLLRTMAWERDYSKSPRFEDHLLLIENDNLATDLLMIAKHFELCHEGSDMKYVSGGAVTMIECIPDSKEPSKEASYISLNQSKRRPNLMEDICHDIQMLVVSDVLKEEASKEKLLESIRTKTAKLAADISSYTQALSLLEDARQNELPAEWMKIFALVQFRPDQPLLEHRTRLVQTAHDVLTASCSEHGLQHILGEVLADHRALILKIGEVRRCRGSFSYPGNPDWGFDDIGMSLGFAYPPHNPGLRVCVLDWGVERLILHFLLSGATEAPTAYDRFSLTISGRDWDIVERWNFRRNPIPECTKDRLHYLSSTSGLLEHLLGGKVPDRVTFLDIQAIVIEDDKWRAARLDYRLGKEVYVMPLFINDNAWMPNRPWTEHAYRNIGNVIENRDFFRSPAEVKKHNAESGDSD